MLGQGLHAQSVFESVDHHMLWQSVAVLSQSEVKVKSVSQRQYCQTGNIFVFSQPITFPAVNLYATILGHSDWLGQSVFLRLVSFWLFTQSVIYIFSRLITVCLFVLYEKHFRSVLVCFWFTTVDNIGRIDVTESLSRWLWAKVGCWMMVAMPYSLCLCIELSGKLLPAIIFALG